MAGTLLSATPSRLHGCWLAAACSWWPGAWDDDVCLAQAQGSVQFF